MPKVKDFLYLIKKCSDGSDDKNLVEKSLVFVEFSYILISLHEFCKEKK